MREIKVDIDKTVRKAGVNLQIDNGNYMAITATYTYDGSVYECQEEQGYYERRTGYLVTESWSEYQQQNIFQDEIDWIQHNRIW